MPPQELSIEPSQPYATVCLISFFLGIALCILINKYCLEKPVIQPIKDSLEKKNSNNIIENFNTRILSIDQKQEKMAAVLTEQTETLKQHFTNNLMQAVFCAVIYQTLLATERHNVLLIKKIKTICSNNNGYVPTAVAAFWMNKYKEQEKLVKQLKLLKENMQISKSPEAPLLLANQNELTKTP